MKYLLTTLAVILTLLIAPFFTNPTRAQAIFCTVSPDPVIEGNTVTINSLQRDATGPVTIEQYYGGPRINLGVNLPAFGSVTATIPAVDPNGLYVVRPGTLGATCTVQIDAAPSGGGGGAPVPGVGTIAPPAGVPTTGGDPTSFVAGLVRGIISWLILGAFVIALFWTIFAGYRFITAGGDEKSIGSAWAQIYWGLIGMLVVLGSFAIIKLVEIFFDVNIITNFRLPTR